MLKQFTLITMLALVTTTAISQNLYKYTINDSVAVFKNGTQFLEPWVGGMNNPQFNELDVNFDCVMDLVIFDRSGDLVRVYINDNVPNEISYHYAPEYARFFPLELEHFLLIRDYNNDGKPDLISSRPGGMRVWKNISDSTLKFEVFAELLRSNGNSNVYAINIDYPVVDDINDDGLLDILSLNIQANFVHYYKNVSVHPDSFTLETDNKCWGMFYENVLNDSIVLGANCKGGEGDENGEGGSSSAARHSGGAMLTLDLFANGVKDLLLADMGYPNMVRLKNGGDPNAANMISVDYHYAGNGSKEIEIPTFPASFFIDINNNGRKDLIVSSNQLDGGIDTGNIWFYDNFGADNNPNFEFVSENIFVKNQLDFGTGALPVLTDVTGDGLADLLVGNVGYFLDFDDNFFQTDYESSIGFYKNIGNDSTPIFEWVTNDIAGLSAKGFTRIAPTFGDLDGDGDNDLLFGENNGSLSYYTNEALPGQMPDFQLVTDTFMGQFFGVQPSPFLFDVDGDNLLDLLVGQKNGNIQLFLNQGTITTPLYTLSATDTLGGIWNYFPNITSNNAIPFIGKVNSSGENILITSDGKGNLKYYTGLDNNLMGNYTLVDSMKVSKSFIGVAGADLNGNDSLEIIIGERPGGLVFLSLDEDAYNYSPYPIDTCHIDGVWEWNDTKNDQFEIIPNPNNGDFRFSIEANSNSVAELSIVDLSGKTTRVSSHQLNTGTNDIYLSNTNLNPGIYIVHIRVNNKVYQSKLVVF